MHYGDLFDLHTLHKIFNLRCLVNLMSIEKGIYIWYLESPTKPIFPPIVNKKNIIKEYKFKHRCPYMLN